MSEVTQVNNGNDVMQTGEWCFVMVGINGCAVTNSDLTMIEARKKLISVTACDFYSFNNAIAYARYMYGVRAFAYACQMGFPNFLPQLPPANLQINQIYLNPQFTADEGNTFLAPAEMMMRGGK